MKVRKQKENYIKFRNRIFDVGFDLSLTKTEKALSHLLDTIDKAQEKDAISKLQRTILRKTIKRLWHFKRWAEHLKKEARIKAWAQSTH